MKNAFTSTLATVLILTGFNAYAELPSVAKQNQYNQGYNQQYNVGSNQFNYPVSYGSGSNINGSYAGQYQNQGSQQQAGNSAQRMYNTVMTGKDLLWMFTSDQSSFGKRLFYVFSGILDRRFLQPIENRIGNLEAGRQGTQTARTGAYPQAAQYCYDCVQQNNTNPNARNPNAINPAIFNANKAPGASAGGIQK